MIAFLYNGKRYATSDIEKKLKKMNITKDDIEIIPYLKQDVEIVNKELIPTFLFKNRYTNEIIISIYDNLNGLVYNNELKTGIRNFNLNEWTMYEN